MMLRSRRAFLQRKALGKATAQKGGCDKLSLSLLVLFMWLVFLFDSCSGHGDAHSDAFCNLVDKSCLREAEPRLMEGSFQVRFSSADMCSVFPEWSSYSTSAEDSEQEFQNYGTTVKGQVEAEYFGQGSEKDIPKSDRSLRDATPGFDEFKNKEINPRGKSGIGKAGSIMHRTEPGGTEYNYASASKGSKVLAFNKEAKGALNILGKDMDKYLRNPCSAEGKFVVIELSEETLVVTIELANFEHYSSNFKDFELLGSLVYPTETWMKLGNFTAKNVKQSQRFTLQDPNWVRYLKINLLSHYGSEFYCTLNVVQVYGVDAVERMLEDLISAQDNVFALEESADEQKPISQQLAYTQSDDPNKNIVTDYESAPEGSMKRSDASNNDAGDQVGDLRPQPVGRMPGDSVLKILMQKVRSLDMNLSLLERYLEDLNSRYGNILKDFKKDFQEKDTVLEKMRSDVMNLVDKKEAIRKDVQDIISWKSLVSLQMDILKRENTFLRYALYKTSCLASGNPNFYLRSEVEKIVQNQGHMENKGIIVLLVSLICIFLVIIKVFVDIAVSVSRREHEFRRFCGINFSWIFLLLSFSTIGFILLV